MFALFGRPEFLRKMHGYATVFWVGMAVPSALWWRDSVAYLVALSVYAVVTGHWSSFQAASTEVKQDQAMEAMENERQP